VIAVVVLAVVGATVPWVARRRPHDPAMSRGRGVPSATDRRFGADDLRIRPFVVQRRRRPVEGDSALLGAPWDVAWTGASAGARAVAASLEPAWTAGASPVPLLRTAADRLRSRRRAETRAAAGRLGVQLVLPLGLCYLPAFVLVGLVPVLVSLASGLLG
jgi:hypothetical protein